MNVVDKLKQTFIPSSLRQPEQQLPIGEKEISEATKTLEEYKEGKANMDKRIIENDKWYRMRHWEQIRSEQDGKKPEPTSAWLFNSLNNKHADAMDNFPEPNVLPREESDVQDAEIISAILPVIQKRTKFENTYSRNWWRKLKSGLAIYGTFWDNKLENGLGDISIKKINPLNFFWEPGIEDIQQSRNVFLVALVDNDILLRMYPQLKDKLGTAPSVTTAQYEHDDTIDTSKKASVVDWYYKQSIENEDGTNKEILHFCKFCNGVVLYSTENDQELNSRGLYDHAQYPFTFDVLFPEEDTPAGFGYVDVMKDPQIYIDKLDQIIMVNGFEAGIPRKLVRDDVGINIDELMDSSKRIIHFTGQINENNYKDYEVKPLDAFIVSHRQDKIEELKETSGNRDFSQGGTASGVTAASAIAALQEAGSKGSRDMIKESYRVFEEINNLCVELIRQFYTEPRKFRITGKNGKEKFITYMNQNIQPMQQTTIPGVDTGYRRPVFDIEIRAQKASPFSTVAMNELAKELYSAGFFNPQLSDQSLIALDMMSFDGKNSLITKISQNSMMTKAMQLLLPMAQQLDSITGSTYTPAVMQMLGIEAQPIPSGQESSVGTVDTNILGKAVQAGSGGIVTNAKATAANTASPR